MSKKIKVLVLVDVQNDFITGSLRNEEAIKAVPRIVERVKSFDGDLIVLTQDTHYPDDYVYSKEGKKLPVPHCYKGTEGWEIEKSVMDAVMEKGTAYMVCPKFTFGDLKLPKMMEEFLKFEADYDFKTDELEIEMCGFCTDICVVSNALIIKANLFNKADIKVVADCCAGVTPESHQAALTTMKMCQIDII